jgi:predicted ATPase/transcriptional regulator with XRE-family HTH domain
MDLPIFFGEWLKRRRKTLDLTQAELGQRVGCSVFTLRKIESGERRPSKQLAYLLARALEIPPEQETAFIRVARGDIRAERLEIDIPVLQQKTLPVETQTPLKNNLPVSLTCFIGRSAELEALGQILHDPYCRILTLVGPGGIGKTRLAIEFASQQLSSFPGGVFFVPLAPLNSPTFLIPAIADALGLEFQGKNEPKIQLINFMRGKQTLLVLDNIEHLFAGLNLLVGLLECVPGLKLLVTSREVLNLKGEWIFELQGLPVPPLSEVDRAEEFSSVALFHQSARRVKANFELRDQDRWWAVKICRILEGIPLGIELAAAWVRILSIHEIYSEIERNIDFLSTPARDLPERHQSMPAVFEQSWRMLAEKEQKGLANLSVFRGGFKREAAEQVAGANLDVLLTLASKSLIRKISGNRYDMHELLRQYVATKLRGIPAEEAGIRSRHSTYYLGWMHASESVLMSKRQKEVLAEMTAEISNLRSAWEWAINTRQISLMEETAWPIYYLHELRSLFTVGERIFAKAVHRIKDEAEQGYNEVSVAYLEAFRGYMAARQGRVTEASQILQHSTDILAAGNAPEKYSITLLFSGIVLRYMGDSQKASDQLRKSHSLAYGTCQSWIHCASAVLVGVAEHDLGHLDESKQWLQLGLNLSRAIGEPVVLAYAISSLIQTSCSMGHFDNIELLLEEGLKLSAEAGHHFTRAMLLEQWARFSFAAGDHEKAVSIQKESITIFRDLHDMWHLSHSLTMMGKFELISGNPVQAMTFFIEAVEIALQDQLHQNAFEALLEIGACLKRQDDIILVLRLAQLILNKPTVAVEIKERARQLGKEMKNQLPAGCQEEAITNMLDQPVEKVASEILNRGRLQLGEPKFT